LPSPPPLRTVHAPFNAYGSSIEQHPCATAPDDSAVPGRLLRSAVGPWARGQPERYCGSAGSRDDFGGGSSTSKGLADPADRSASLPNAGWLTVHARRHQKEVCPLSRGVMSQPLSGLLPAGLRLLPPPIPAVLLGHLTIPLAVGVQQGNGLTTFRRWNSMGGLGRVSPPVVQHLRWRSSEPPDLTTCLLAQASQHLWLVLSDDV